MRAGTAWLGGLVLMAGTGARLFAQGPLPSLSSGLTQLDCTFTTSVAAAWDAPEPSLRVRKDPPLAFRIGNIDAAGGSAEIMLGALTVPALVIINGSTLHFVEPPEGGQTAITSVAAPGGATRFRASYSRTEYYAYSGTGFTSTPKAEQYYGYCEATPPVR